MFQGVEEQEDAGRGLDKSKSSGLQRALTFRIVKFKDWEDDVRLFNAFLEPCIELSRYLQTKTRATQLEVEGWASTCAGRLRDLQTFLVSLLCAQRIPIVLFISVVSVTSVNTVTAISLLPGIVRSFRLSYALSSSLRTQSRTSAKIQRSSPAAFSCCK